MFGICIAFSSSVTFVTLTSNQATHPGVAPIFNTINSHFAKETEVKTASVQTYMSLILRRWERSVGHLIDLISNSIILGKVIKVWGRAEFQSTRGNLPHYHLLKWLAPETVDLDYLIKSCEKHIFGKLTEIFHSKITLTSSFELFAMQ